MDLAQCCRQAHSYLQDTDQIERPSLAPLQNQIQGLAARIFEYEDRSSFVTSKSQRLGCKRRFKFCGEQVFVLEPPEALRRRLFGR